MGMAGRWLAVTLGLMFSIATLAAHHSVVSQFDRNNRVTLKGTITKVEWQNPHIWVYLDVPNEDGTVEAWECEGSSPITLRRQGWTRTTLRVGIEVTIDGARARDGSNRCNSRNWTLADGRHVFVGSPADGLSQQPPK